MTTRVALVLALIVAGGAGGGCTTGAQPPASAPPARPVMRAVCHDRAVRILDRDSDGNVRVSSFSCEGDKAVAVVIDARGRDQLRHARWELVEDEWRRMWELAEATGWRKPTADCSDEPVAGGPPRHMWVVTITDGATGRTVACDVRVHPGPPFAALDAGASTLVSGIPDTSWNAAPRAKIGLVPRIGVPECDDFMVKYLACVEQHMPESTRQITIDSLRQTADAWAQAASTPEGRAALANACRQMTDSTRQATAAMGCTW